MATFIAKMTDTSQYNANTATIIWGDSKPKRWNDIYGKLLTGDNCIFLSDTELYVGDYSSSINNTSVTFNRIKSVKITTSDLLRIDILNPETLAVLKRPPGPLLRINIDVNKVFDAATTKEFISFYIVREGNIAGILPTLKPNDRVITIDQNDKLIEISTVLNGALKPKVFETDYFNSKDKTLNEILIITRVAQKNKSSNNVKNIQKIIKALGTNDFYKFPSFNDYYNIIHNKKLYANKLQTVGIEDIDEGDDFNDAIEIPKNLILYGPPGTGKTYSSINEALKIMELDLTNLDRESLKTKFAEFQKAKRVFFTTFHQNMAYEDFIEGIKPIAPEDDDDYLKYEVQDGLFMKACIEATFNYIQKNFEEEKVLEELLGFNELFDKLYDRVSNNDSENLETKSGGQVIASVTSKGNFAIRHVGKDKPYTVSRDRLSKIFALYQNPDEISNVQNAFRKAIGGCNSTAYWSVLKAVTKIKENQNDNNISKKPSIEEISYDDKRIIVQKYWDKKDYLLLKEDNSDPYVYIIDEINRGNVAQIFGELITLIEDDKRMGKLETLYTDLPYSKKSFAIPPNLYIIGTMNTADRSVEALDTALRRRFSFIHMIPIADELETTFDGINLKDMLNVINKRLSILKDSDHTIGHAWLWNVTNIEQLKTVFGNKILPLLQEYFYNDYEKMGLVLGDRFFKDPVQIDSDSFAKFTSGNSLASQYDQSLQYQLKPVDDLMIEDFQSLEN